MAVGVDHRGHGGAPVHDRLTIRAAAASSRTYTGSPVDERHRHRVAREAVGQRLGRPVEEHEVRALADLDRASVVADAQDPGGVEGGRPQQLAGMEAVQPRGETEHRSHREHRSGAGVAVGGQHDDRPGLDERPARGAVLRAQELGRREQHGRARGGGQRSDVVGVQGREVIDGARPRLEGHRDRAIAAELLDVAAQRQPGAGRQLPHQRQVLVGEGHRLDEDVERRDGAGGHHLGHHRLDLGDPLVGGEAVGHGVGQERRRERRLGHLGVERVGKAQRPQLAVARQPVAGLALEGRRAGGQHLAGQPPGLGEDLLVARSRSAHGPRRGCRRPRARSPHRGRPGVFARTRPTASRRTADGCGSRRARG